MGLNTVCYIYIREKTHVQRCSLQCYLELQKIETAHISIYKEMVKCITFELCNQMIYSALKGWASFICTDLKRSPWYIKWKKAAKYRLVNVIYSSLGVEGKYTYVCEALDSKVVFCIELFITTIQLIKTAKIKMLLKIHLLVRWMGVLFMNYFMKSWMSTT